MKLHHSRLIAAAIVVAAGLVIAGCGSSSPSASTPPPAATSTGSQSTSTPATGTSTGSESTSTPAAPTSTGSESTSTPAATTIKVEADPGGQLAFVQKTLTAPAGASTIAFTNASPVPHNIAVESGGKAIGPSKTIMDGGTTTLSIKLPAGTYEFYCDVPGHRQAGMKGVLTVT